MRYRIDSMSLRGGELVIDGWAFGASDIRYELKHADGSKLPAKAVKRERADVTKRYGAPLMCGFTIKAAFDRSDEAWLCLTDGRARRRVHINGDILERRNSAHKTGMARLRSLMTPEKLDNALQFLKENGMKAFVIKARNKLKDQGEDYDYPQWERLTSPDAQELARQREESGRLRFSYGDGFSLGEGRTQPLVSIVIPAYNTPARYLRMLFDSLRAQTYGCFEVIVSDGSEGDESVREVTEEYAAKDSRFRYLGLGGNRGIAGNTNAGLSEAHGDYIALCDHDDELPPYALYEVARAISEHPEGLFFYTDEDKADFDGKALFEPHFKPDYDPELLLCVNYICHLSVIRRDLLEKVGGFRPEFDGAQDYDFFLRCTEEAEAPERELLRSYRALLAERDAMSPDTDAVRMPEDGSGAGAAKLTAGGVSAEEVSEACGCSIGTAIELLSGRFTSECIIHIPKVCYHWRYHRGSTASDPRAKLYAFEAGARAIKAHYERLAARTAAASATVQPATAPSATVSSASGAEMLPVPESVDKGVTYGYYQCRFPMPEEGPLIAVLIPNKDHIDDLRTCMGSIAERSTYRHIEFIVIENNSEAPETWAYYEELERAGEIGGLPVRVVRWEREFNYSAINNFGAGFARGQYLLLLNNDVELREPDSIWEMLSYAMRREIGIVGARLCYPDDTIQHAGVIVGLGGIAGAAFVGSHEKENTYMHRMMSLQDLSAVTAACLLIRKETYEAVGGLCEDYAVAFNDIDLCMKVRRLGLRVVYDPYAVFYHYESKSRGLEDTPEKVMRFNGEIAIFASRWPDILRKGDPYYNPNLTLRKANFALRDLTKEKPGEPYELELDVEKQLRTVLAEKRRRGG